MSSTSNNEQANTGGRSPHMSIRLMKTRSGTAPIEFLMFIPVVVGFMAVMIWMVRVQNRAIQVGINAEVAASEQAVIQSQQAALPTSKQLGHLSAAGDFQQLVDAFVTGLSATKGVIHTSNTLDTGEGVANLIQPVGTVQDEHWLLAHSFEAEVFAFPQQPSEQRELTFPTSILGIAPQIGDLNRFRYLLQFSGQGHTMTGDSVQSLNDGVIDSQQKIRKALEEVRSKIAEIESKIRQLQNQPDPDWAAIQKLRQELDKLRQQEQKLKQGLRHADDALSG